MRAAEVEHRSQRVRRVDGLHRRIHRLERMMLLVGLDGEFHILRRDRLAIVEARIVAQLDGHLEAAVGDLPAFRQIGLRVPLIVEPEQRREQLRSGNARGRAGGDRRIEMPGDDPVRECQGPAPFGLLRRRCRRGQDRSRRSQRHQELFHIPVLPIGSRSRRDARTCHEAEAASEPPASSKVPDFLSTARPAGFGAGSRSRGTVRKCHVLSCDVMFRRAAPLSAGPAEAPPVPILHIVPPSRFVPFPPPPACLRRVPVSRVSHVRTRLRLRRRGSRA